MSEIKKEAIVILFFVFWVVTSLNVLADEVGCCTNPGAGSLTCSADRLTLRDRECCPKPEANFPSYYSSEQNQESPANSNECATNFFFPNTACSAVQTCALGCCCSESGGTIKPEAQCQGSGLTFHRSQTNCNQICPVPQCNDGRDNDNNGCADFENGDLGCTSPADNDESGGTCSRQGVGCNNPSYTPRLSNFEISLAKGQKKFLLRWRDECSENAVSYDILRCKGSECTNFELVGTATTISFEDTSGDLLFDTAYTYQIKAHYTPQTAVPTITKTANLGNIECLEQTNTNKFCIQEYYYNRYKNYLITNFPEEFSQNFQDGVRNEFGGKLNKPFLCNEFNQLLPGGTACPSNKLCIVTNNQPSCISKISCNYNAANPFGLYYTLQDCETNRYCFYDRSHSTVNSCFSCEPSMSCYDYKTEEACSRDNCRVRNCRWKNLANQIGIGVCISTSEYNCKWCDKKGTDNLENIKAFNEIFDLCTREKSNLLSEGQFKCYFRDGNSKNCDEVTCNDYSSAQCSTAQITHDENNRIRNPSTDDCGIKVCQNINNQCVKNADGDNAPDCEGAECEKDYIPPNTTISPVIRRGILDRLLIQIYDKTSINGFSTLRTSQDYKTYLCVEPCGSNGHPYDASTTSRAIIISNLNAFDSDNGNRLLTLNEGTNVIRYYSQDPAKNIGEVKKITVEVHGNLDGPKVLSIEVSDGSKVLDKYFTRNQKPTINVQFVEPAIVTFARLINRRTGFILSLQGSTQLNTRATFSITQDLPNGEYTFELNAKNGANIFMDQLFSAIIVIDNASPTLIIIPSNDAVITTSLVKINLTFSKEVNLETVNINSEDIKNRFSTTDNKEFIAEISLSDGNKRLEASANDYAGNQVSGYVSFIVDANPTAINLISPRFGTSSRYTFDIVLETDNNAICRFAIDNNFEFDFMDAFTATGSTIHTISNFNRIANGDTNTHKLNVRCNNGRGQSSKSFDINVDTTPPHLRNVFAYPNPIIERPSTTELTIEADEPVICKHSTTSREFSGMDNKFEGFDSNNFKTINKQSVTVENEGSYSYFVACKNKAELNSESKEIQFKVDLSIPISIISHTPEFFNSTDIVLAIETTKRSQCKFSETDNTAQNGEIFGAPGYSHTKQLKLNPGRHTFFVICRDQSLQRFSDVASITFTIDVTPPIILSVNDSSTLEDKPEFTWNTDSLRVKWNSIDNESRVSYHNYSLIESGTSNAIINWTTSYANNEWVVVTKPNPGWNLVNGNSYFFRVKARNIVGLISDVKESDGITIDTSLKPSNCTNKAKDEKETDVDCGGVCSLCDLGKKCNINADCKSSFCNVNNICATPKCDDNIRNQEETDVDCGGSCKKCQNDKTCVSNNDCESGYCGYGSCKPQESCLDGKLSGIESDVDCGGACPTKCPEEKNCGTSEDCAEGLKCVLSVCKRCAENDENCNGIPDEQEETKTEIKDTDNDGMPDDWEIKNGLNPNDPNDAEQDSDNDGLTNLEEYKLNTNPNLADTDGDTFTDKQEVDARTNPLDDKDFPKSNLMNIILSILGIVVLFSGFGYLTYRLMEKRKEEKFKLEPRGVQRIMHPQQVQQQAKQIPSKQTEEKAKIKEAFKKKEEEKEKERKKLFEAFGKEEKSKEELKETKIEKPEHKSEKKPSDIRKTRLKKPKEDVFIKLKEIAKETKKKRK